MFKILVRSLETETYQPLPRGPYQTRGEAEDALKRMSIQVRTNGKYIAPEEFEIVEEWFGELNMQAEPVRVLVLHSGRNVSFARAAVSKPQRGRPATRREMSSCRAVPQVKVRSR